MPETAASPLEKVPPPEEIRARLAENIREARALRSLLKVSQRLDRERQQAAGGSR